MRATYASPLAVTGPRLRSQSHHQILALVTVTKPLQLLLCACELDGNLFDSLLLLGQESLKFKQPLSVG